MHDSQRTYCRSTDSKDGRSQMIFLALLSSASLIAATLIVASASLTVVAHQR